LTTSETVANNENTIYKIIPDDLKADQAFMNLARAIHTTAYMRIAIVTVRKYLRYLQKDKPSKLIIKNKSVAEKQLSDYLTNSTIRNASKRVEFAMLKLFYTQNDVILNWAKISKQIGKRERSRNRGYIKEEIAKILEFARDIRDRVVILVLASTGMRIEGLAKGHDVEVSLLYFNSQGNWQAWFNDRTTNQLSTMVIGSGTVTVASDLLQPLEVNTQGPNANSQTLGLVTITSISKATRVPGDGVQLGPFSHGYVVKNCGTFGGGDNSSYGATYLGSPGNYKIGYNAATRTNGAQLW
jgi:hypothetical protein